MRIRFLFGLLLASYFITTGCRVVNQATPSDFPLLMADIRIRDPFIWVDKKEGLYYLYAQMRNRREAPDAPQGVEVYSSRDLLHWSQPQPVLILPADFPDRRSVWAPEVHRYKGVFYLFVTLTSDRKISEYKNPLNGETLWKRGTYIFRSKSPTGPFSLIKEGPHTPADWMSLDGTLWVEAGRPWMVFCHEWAQTLDGTMDLVALSRDLSATAGQPVTLFKASDGSWVRNMQQIGFKRNGWVTDGPFIYKNKKGRLVMIWSSFGDQQYAIGQAVSPNGSINGPWVQSDQLLVSANGGHGMLFRDLHGQLQLAYHQPNTNGLERLHLVEVKENEAGMLELSPR